MLSSGFSFNAMSISLDMAARDLGIAEKDLQWTFNALYLAMGCTTLVAGRTADIFGRKAVYLVGIALFGIFSLVASFMHNPEGFFVNRAMCGLGVAMILASNAGIIVENTSPGRTRSVLLSVANTGLPLGNLVALGVVGPLIEATNQLVAFSVLVSRRDDCASLPGNSTVRQEQANSGRAGRPENRLDWRISFYGWICSFILSSVASSIHTERVGNRLHHCHAGLIIRPGRLCALLAMVLGTRNNFSSCHPYKRSHPKSRKIGVSVLCGREFASQTILIGTKSMLIFDVGMQLCSMGCFSGWQYTTTLYYQKIEELRPLQFALRYIPGPVAGIVFNVLVDLYLGRAPTHWFLCLAASAGYIYVTKVVKPEEVAAANGAIHFLGSLRGCIGPALATLVYTNVADTDVQLQVDQLSHAEKSALLRGLRASYWFWAGLSFFVTIISIIFLRNSDSTEEHKKFSTESPSIASPGGYNAAESRECP